MNAVRERTGTGPLWVAAFAIVFLIALAWFLSNGTGGLQSSALEVMETGRHNGTWLSDLAVWLLGMLPLPVPIEARLAIFSAAVLGALLAWFYQRLVYNDWPILEALVFVACLASNSIIVSAVTADHRAIPLLLACAIVVPGMRRLEAVGDVQAEMSFGLVLPLLFLAGPMTALLIPVLAAFGAWSDPDARRDGRAFVAMFLIAIMPTLLVLTGMFGMLGIADAVRLFDEVYAHILAPALLGPDEARLFLATFAYTVLPFAIVIIPYWLTKDRRRQPWSAFAVLALPVYLVAGALVFSWPMAPTLPTAVFLGAFAAWLSVARLTPVFRYASIALMLLGTIVSWSGLVRSEDPKLPLLSNRSTPRMVSERVSVVPTNAVRSASTVSFQNPATAVVPGAEPFQ